MPRFSAAVVALSILHALFWGSVDVDLDRGTTRARRLYGAGSVQSPEAVARAAEELAIAERLRGTREAALAWYRIAAEAMPPHWRHSYNRATLASRLGHAAEAEEAYVLTVALNPDHASPYRGLGALYVRTGRPENAIRVYEQGLAKRKLTHTEVFNASTLDLEEDGS